MHPDVKNKMEHFACPELLLFPGKLEKKKKQNKQPVTLYKMSTPFHCLQHNANTVSAHIRDVEERSLIYPCKNAINPESSPAQKQESSAFVALIWKNAYTFVCLFVCFSSSFFCSIFKLKTIKKHHNEDERDHCPLPACLERGKFLIT